MAWDKTELETRARRAYEIGRIQAAARGVWLLAPMTLLACLRCGQPALSLTTGALLFAAVFGLLWRGRAWSAAVTPGLLAGAVPFLLPLLVGYTGHVCVGGVCFALCMPPCLIGGLVAGFVLGLRAARMDEGRGAFLLAGCLVAALEGALGCAPAGIGSLLGMAAGVVVISAPLGLTLRLSARS